MVMVLFNRRGMKRDPMSAPACTSSLCASLTAGHRDGADDRTEAKLVPCPRLGSGQRA